MTKNQVAIGVAVIAGVCGIIAAAIPLLIQSKKTAPKPVAAAVPVPAAIVMRGVVMRDEANPEKRYAIPGVRVMATNGVAPAPVLTGTNGMFELALNPAARNGQVIDLNFSHGEYQEKDETQVIAEDVPYVFYLWPKTYAGLRLKALPMPSWNLFPAAYAAPETLVTTFQVINRGSVRCNGRQPCSPDGKWKAQIKTASLAAGRGKRFLRGHADCIAGPCPWTKIEMDGFSKGGPAISVAVRNWSDTVTYKLWGEVVASER